MSDIQIIEDSKDPAASADFAFDWNANTFLGTDTISSSSWGISGPDATLTNLGETNTTTKTTVKVGAGTEGYIYRVRNTIVTTDGKTWVRTLYLEIEHR